MSARRRKVGDSVSNEGLKDTIQNQRKKLDAAFENIKNIFNKKEKEEQEKNKKLTREEKITEFKGKLIEQCKAINKYKCVAVLLSIVIGFIGIYFITNYHLYGLTLIKDVTESDAIVYQTMTSNRIIKPYGEYILIVENDTMTAINRYGKVEWTKSLNESFTPNVSIAGNYIQLANMDTGRVYVYNSKYEIARIEVGSAIYNAVVNKDGVSVIQYSVPGAKTSMSVYSSSGKELKRINLNVDNVVNISINGNRYLAYTYLDLSGVSVISCCEMIDLKTEEIIKVWTEKNEILYDVFWDKDKLYCRLNDVILVYDSGNKNLERYDTYGLNASFIDVDENEIAILNPATNFGYNFSLLKYGKKLDLKAYLEHTPISFKYIGNLAYICTKKDIYVYSKYGINAKNIKLDLSISEWLVFNYGKSVCIISGNQLLIFNI